MSSSKVCCKSLSKLSHVAEEFMIQDSRCGSGAGVIVLLQVCLDTLEAYRDEYKNLKKEGEMSQEAVYHIYESAYVYYKIVHNLVLNRIPNLDEFHQIKKRSNSSDKKLMELYNMLVKSLLYDEKIGGVKTFIKEHSYDENRELKNGGFISARALENLLITDDAHVLVVDVRQRDEFDQMHIRASNVICIEPISFKNTYTDLELEKKSMITSPNEEIDIFKRRQEFKFIILYTDGNKENVRHNLYLQQEMVLLELLMARSFAKPLHKDVKILVLEAGISSWKFNGGRCSSSNTANSNQAIYLNGHNTTGLKLQLQQQLSRLKPDVSSSTGPSVKDMVRSNTQDHNNNVHYDLSMQQQQQQQQHPPQSVNLINSLSQSSTLSSIASPSPLSHHSDLKFANYPIAPQLAEKKSVNSKNVATTSASSTATATATTTTRSSPSNGNGVVSPVNLRAITPARHTIISSSPKSQNILTPNGTSNSVTSTNKVLSKASSQPLPVLPRLPTKSSNNSEILSTKTKTKEYDLDFKVGLENMGNSCYINCIIQCLLGTHELTNIFLNNSYERHINLNSKLGSKGVLAKSFAKLIHQMYQNAAFKKKKAVKPYEFKIACGSINSIFRESGQQDSQEFCQFLLDGLHEDLNQCGGNPPLKELSEEAEKMREKLSMRIASSIEWERYLTRDFSVIVDLFQGQYASQLRCKVCNHTSTTYQPFSILSAPVPHAKSCYLVDCFKEFTKVEEFEKDEEWSCPYCKKKQPSTKKLTITRLPRNLIIHLKRFDNMLNKNNVLVNYPFVLDLTPFWANDFDGKLPPGVTEELPSRGQVPPFKYKLYAVASHSGSLYGGHYTAFVDKGKDKGWYYFDDTGYRQMRTPTECITSNAYVLFYHRVYGV